jgi:SAM-dependent methyltransferase
MKHPQTPSSTLVNRSPRGILEAVVGSPVGTGPGDDAVQARTYDFTRGASPTIVRALTRFLGPPNGRLLLDVAGGTGNYAAVFAARGFRVLVVDASLAMVRHAKRKLGPAATVVGDAERLPLRDRAADCAMVVDAVHLFGDLAAALHEARRVLRAGPLALTALTRENLGPLFVCEYFDLSEPVEARPSTEEVERLLADCGFSRVERATYVYTDAADGSLTALHTNPLHLAGPAYLRNTSFWHRLDEDSRRQGLARLARDLRSGVLERRVRESFKLAARQGHGTVFAAWP